MQNLLIIFLQFSRLSIVFLHFLLDKTLFDAELSLEPLNFFITFRLHFSQFFFVLSFSYLQCVVLVEDGLILFSDLTVFLIQINFEHIVLFLDLIKTALVGLEFLLLLAKFLLQLSLLCINFEYLLILEPSSCLHIIEFIHSLRHFVSWII